MTTLDRSPWEVLDPSEWDGPDVPDEAAGPAASAAPPVLPPPRPRPVRARVHRWAVLAVVLATVAGGISGGVVARLTPREQRRATGQAATNTDRPTSASATTVPTAARSNAAQRASFDVPTVIAQVGRSVVSIDVSATTTTYFGRTYQQGGAGSGFVLSAEGLIATNAHVVEGADTIVVTLPDGTHEDATLVGSAPGADLAVLRIARTDLVPLPIGSSADIPVGTSVVAVGNALALEGGPTASLGIISAVGRSITTSSGNTYTELLQTDAAINAGDSGGPLVDGDGEVIGINTAGTTEAENIGFAIPIDVAAPVLAGLAGIEL